MTAEGKLVAGGGGGGGGGGGAVSGSAIKIKEEPKRNSGIDSIEASIEKPRYRPGGLAKIKKEHQDKKQRAASNKIVGDHVDVEVRRERGGQGFVIFYLSTLKKRTFLVPEDVEEGGSRYVSVLDKGRRRRMWWLFGW